MLNITDVYHLRTQVSTTCALCELSANVNSEKSSISAFCVPFASTVVKNKVTINNKNTLKNCILRMLTLVGEV